MKNYMKRITDELLNTYLSATGAVVIEGPKWCGKTTTALNIANSTLIMDNPDSKQNNLDLALYKPSLLLKGNTPRLIDEWQLAPQL